MTSNKKSDKFLNNIIEKMDMHDKCKIQIEKQESEITKDVFNIYRFKETQDDLLHQLEETNYSMTRIEEIKTIFLNYDSSSITFNTAEKLIEAQKHVKETHSYEDNIKNTFFSKIGNQIFHK